MKKHLVSLLKMAAAIGLLAFLISRASVSLQGLPAEKTEWGLLGLAAGICLAAVLVCFWRWYYLVRALDLPFRMRDALRLGFLGYLLNFVSLGSVGGDLFKAIFIAREHPGRRAEAVATVFVDRVIGLYALFVVAAIGVLLGGLYEHHSATLRLLARSTLAGTVLGGAALVVMISPGFSRGKVTTWISRVPKVGPIVVRLIAAVRAYRRRPGTLAWTGLQSLWIHTLTILCMYTIAQALPGSLPTLADHFLIVPLAILAGAMPIVPNGLGSQELVMDFLYTQSPSATPILAGQGMLVALVYRAVTMGVAIVGLAYYVANRALVAQIMRESAETSLEGQPVTDDEPADVLSEEPIATPES